MQFIAVSPVRMQLTTLGTRELMSLLTVIAAMTFFTAFFISSTLVLPRAVASSFTSPAQAIGNQFKPVTGMSHHATHHASCSTRQLLAVMARFSGILLLLGRIARKKKKKPRLTAQESSPAAIKDDERQHKREDQETAGSWSAQHGCWIAISGAAKLEGIFDAEAKHAPRPADEKYLLSDP
jgi:hypothetical protein